MNTLWVLLSLASCIRITVTIQFYFEGTWQNEASWCFWSSMFYEQRKLRERNFVLITLEIQDTFSISLKWTIKIYEQYRSQYPKLFALQTRLNWLKRFDISYLILPAIRMSSNVRDLCDLYNMGLQTESYCSVLMDVENCIVMSIPQSWSHVERYSIRLIFQQFLAKFCINVGKT